MKENPSHVCLLVTNDPNYLNFTDACGLGAGGVISSGNKDIAPIVWQFEWPDEIKKELITADNPSGTITINDLELAGMLLGWLILELSPAELRYAHVGTFCDNTSAVSWATKGQTSKSIPAARLLRFLFIRQRIRQTSSLVPLHLSGDLNIMADVSSRAFKNGKYFLANTTLLAYFNKHFPLPQGKSWTQYHVPTKLSLRVISCLRGKQLPMEQLAKLPKTKRGTGDTGVLTLPPTKRIRTLNPLTTSQEASSPRVLLQGSGLASTDEERRSKFTVSQMRSRPSPRPVNWLENRVHSSKQRPHTFYPSNDASKASEDKMPHQSHS